MVHENACGAARSNHRPKNAPPTVGTAIDQPTMPKVLMPRNGLGGDDRGSISSAGHGVRCHGQTGLIWGQGVWNLGGWHLRVCS